MEKVKEICNSNDFRQFFVTKERNVKEIEANRIEING